MCECLAHRKATIMFEKIVVGVDGSEQSKRALLTACDVAKKYGSELFLVHSPEVETTGIAVGSGAVEIEADPEVIAAAGEKTMQAAREDAAQAGCIPAQCFVGNDAPASEILKCAEDIEADLIVLGRRGLGSVKSLLLGSVSQKVSHEAKCACMTVNH